MSEGGAAGAAKSELLARARAAFRERFGRDADFVGAAPGRVNLMGDHVDYAGGLALPMAIDRWTVAAGAWSRDPRRVKLLAVDLDETAELDLDASTDDDAGRVLGAAVGHWSGYIAGVYVYLMLETTAGCELRGVDLAVTSSVPRASGLSSSAALELSVAVVLDRAWGLEVPADQLALDCQQAEHLGGGVRCGAMDQLASALGVEGHALRVDFSDLSVIPVPISPGLAVLVVDTRTPRRLAAGAYDQLVWRVQRAEGVLGRSLRRSSLGRIAAAALDSQAKASAAHVFEESARVLEAAVHLASGDARALAREMHASHASLRDRLGVSCPELEAVVTAAAACGPEVGARLTGAGMGGCTVVVCEELRAAEVARRVREGFGTAVGRECEVMRVHAVDGAGCEG